VGHNFSATVSLPITVVDGLFMHAASNEVLCATVTSGLQNVSFGQLESSAK